MVVGLAVGLGEVVGAVLLWCCCCVAGAGVGHWLGVPPVEPLLVPLWSVLWWVLKLGFGGGLRSLLLGGMRRLPISSHCDGGRVCVRGSLS